MKNTSLLILCSGIICTLTGCSGTKETLGLGRKTPDEFAVIKRAPLEIPPDLRALPIPQKGAPRPQEDTAEESAQKALFGENEQRQASVSTQEDSAEKSLLRHAGASESPSDIRALIDKEAEEFAQGEQPVIDKLLKRKKTVPGSKLDAREELERLQDKSIPTPNIPQRPEE